MFTIPQPCVEINIVTCEGHHIKRKGYCHCGSLRSPKHLPVNTVYIVSWIGDGAANGPGRSPQENINRLLHEVLDHLQGKTKMIPVNQRLSDHACYDLLNNTTKKRLVAAFSGDVATIVPQLQVSTKQPTK